MIARLLLVLSVASAFAGAATAQSFPSRPLRVLPNSAAGTGPDLLSRVLAAKLQEAMGQPVVVENRPGANGNLAGELVARSPADGYTLMMATDAQLTINPHVYAKQTFDWIKDLMPVAPIATEAFKLVVSNEVPAKTVAEFIAYAKSVKKPLFYGSAGNGSQHHLTMEILKERTGIELTHVPFKGGGAATAQALLSGEIQATIGGAAVDGQVKAGKLRALGITSPTRSKRYPELPPIGDTVPGFQMVAWYGLFAPSGTPAEPVSRLRTEVSRALSQPDVQAKVNASGPEVWLASPEEFASAIRAGYERHGKIVKALGVTMD